MTRLQANRDRLAQRLHEEIPGIRHYPPESTYLAWLDVSKVVDKIGASQLAVAANKSVPAPPKTLTSEAMVERYFVKHAKVQMNPGSNYGYGGSGHMRMNIATSRKLVELALTNIAKALNDA